MSLPDDTVDAKSRSWQKIRRHSLLILLLIILIGIYFYYLAVPPRPIDLAARAINAPTDGQRRLAVVELDMRREPDPVPELRKILAESKDPKVLVQVIQALAARMDGQSASQLFSALGHPDRSVRSSALRALEYLSGVSGVAKVNWDGGFDPAENPEVVRKLRETYGRPVDPKNFAPDRRQAAK